MPLLQLLSALLAAARSSLKSQHVLALENLALRQQLAILQRRTKRPRLTKTDRAFWVALSRLWTGWQGTLIVVKPQTVISWHRKGFRLYWRSLTRVLGIIRMRLPVVVRTRCSMRLQYRRIILLGRAELAPPLRGDRGLTPGRARGPR